MKTGGKIFIGCIVLILITVGAFFFAKNRYDSMIDTPNSDSSTVVEVDILPGTDIKTISKTLKDKDVIQNAELFYWYVKFENLGPNIQAGTFYIPKNLTVIQVAETLQKAAGDDIWVSFQEGLRGDEIAAELQAQFLQYEGTEFDKDKFLDIYENPDNYDLTPTSLLAFKPEGYTLEGFLFPDTYNVNRTIVTEELVELFLETFEQKLGEDAFQTLEESEEGFYDSLILASIVEREGKNAEEREMIAGILLTRLHEGLEDGTKLLQTDATLLYLQKDWLTPVTEELKQQDTAYNTYLNPGLPPTPISNPGLESLLAVVDPTENSYLYYLHGNDGSIHYAKTFEEHERNQRCYIHENTEYCP